MESKKISQLATELSPDLSDLTIIGDPTTGISKKITLSQMASLFTGTVEEYANLAAFPLVGVADTIYIALDTNIIYRWDTSLSTYVVLSPNIINSLVFSDANGFDGTITLVGSVATLSITTALTLGSVPFIGASGALTQDNSNLFFDDTNNRLGIGTASPTTPLDVFGSGIIGRLNATSTNNAYLGFASNGTNKWSAGNVQSDHRFRIFSEANSAELVSLLQTGEFGIGIANPTTKFHIDGAATALIANLDANVSVAKSVSYRSDNSARINLEVSGTESGSNAGADFFLRTFTDAGSLLETPFTIVRSTGVTTIKSLTLTNVLSVANGGTGSATQNFVDLTTTQSIGGAKTFTSALAGTSASFSSTATATAFIPSGATIPTNGMYLSAANTLNFATNTTNRLSISSTGAATFSSSVQADFLVVGTTAATSGGLRLGTQVAIRARNVANTANIPLIESTATDAVAIASGGANVGIGTSSPSANFILDINSTKASGASGMRLSTISSSAGPIFVLNYTGGSLTNWGIGAHQAVSGALEFVSSNSAGGDPATAGTTRMMITNAGAVLIGKTTDASAETTAGTLLIGNGRAIFTADGSYSVFSRLNTDGYILTFNKGATQVGSISTNANSLPSDLNFKKNINNLELGLNLIEKLRPVSYNLKIDDLDAALSSGFIAQELEQSLTELGVKENEYYILQHIPNEDETQSQYWLDYTKMIPVLVKAIQELKAEIDLLKAK